MYAAPTPWSVDRETGEITAADGTFVGTLYLPEDYICANDTDAFVNQMMYEEHAEIIEAIQTQPTDNSTQQNTPHK